MWGYNLKFEVLGHKIDEYKVALQTCGKSSTKAEIFVTAILSAWRVQRVRKVT
jgi:hypothetical protein